MPEEISTNGVEKPYTKKAAIAYLGIAMRTLEYAMQSRSIDFEKHGRKVIFRKAYLDDYRNKAQISTQKSPVADQIQQVAPTSFIETPRLHGNDARDLLSKFQAVAQREKRVTKETARSILLEIGRLSDLRADEVLQVFEAECLAAYQLLGNKAPERLILRMDWSHAVAPYYLDFERRVERWDSLGKNESEYVFFKTPLEPWVDYPERMLSCLQTIHEAEFLTMVRETHRFYDSYSPGKLVPFKALFERSPLSVNRAPFSFAGPVTQDGLEKLLLKNFSLIDQSNILIGQAISLQNIAKLKWLFKNAHAHKINSP